ncbi:PH domain-containing protein [Nakamurella sp. PAMC28650]|jgi:hypothetical protein|uniref:PH domain-containing protein n=1 Tax=Nakamurella sp. PAMC28650 TaxID=2762325 RepID=UPI00164D6BBB|nr:PH domain-containing protein [Nakamurella sp. PAMC28650]QNK83206.1 PH domain-containing protein [Nakamurella sp. PAMC28650]
MSNEGKPTTEPLLVIRPHKIAILAVISASAVFLAMVLVGILLHNTNDGVSFQTSDQIGLGGLGLLIGIAILMMARPTLKVFPEGMLIRNILGENFYEWALIYEVSFPQGAQWALLRMPDDETHPVMAIQLLDRGRAVESLQAVRKLHARYAPPPPKSAIPDEEALRILEQQENNRPLGRLEIIDRVKAAKGKGVK